jgi:hypothetical protein
VTGPAEFEFHRYKPVKLAVKEQQINIVVLVIDRDPLLPGHERETDAQLQDERLEFSQNRRLEIRLAVTVVPSQEVQHVRGTEDQVGCQQGLRDRAASPPIALMNDMSQRYTPRITDDRTVAQRGLYTVHNPARTAARDVT